MDLMDPLCCALQVLGVDVVYESIPFDTYRASGAPGAADMGNMFQFYHDFEARPSCDPTLLAACCVLRCIALLLLTHTMRSARSARSHQTPFVAQRDLEVARRLHPGLQSFESWLRAHADAFKAVL
jgi:hypothetical protein